MVENLSDAVMAAVHVSQDQDCLDIPRARRIYKHCGVPRGFISDLYTHHRAPVTCLIMPRFTSRLNDAHALVTGEHKTRFQ